MKHSIIIILLFLSSFLASAQQIVADTISRIGKLDNGFSYYIHHCDTPKGQTDFYFLEKIGSLVEEDDERGLAHFIEHMAFNGSEHFPNKGIIRYCEKIGTKFGEHLNALTSYDRTIYRISEVQTTKYPESVDSCLLILKDWADGITLEDREIENERGVIHQEWLDRSNYHDKTSNEIVGFLDGVRYAERDPIGQLSIIDSIPPQKLRDFHKKWYQPQFQGVVVVGDISIDSVENKVKELFGSIIHDEGSASSIPVFKDTRTPEPAVEIKESGNKICVLLNFNNDTDSSFYNPNKYYFNYFKKLAIHTMLSLRILETTMEEDTPLEDIINTTDCQSPNFSLSYTLLPTKDGSTIEAIKAVYREILRMARNGITDSEFIRAKAFYLESIEKKFKNQSLLSSYAISEDYITMFFDSLPLRRINEVYKLSKEIIPQLDNEQIRLTVDSLLTNGNIKILVLLPKNQKDNIALSKDEVLAGLKSVESEDILPYKDEQYFESQKMLPDVSPQVPGRIIKEKIIKKGKKKSESNEYTLSNGVKVSAAQPDTSTERITLLLSNYRHHKLSSKLNRYEKEYINEIIRTFRDGHFSSSEIKKFLYGKKIAFNHYVSENKTETHIQAAPWDLENALKLKYLHFTNLQKDEIAFQRWKQDKIKWINKRGLDCEYIFKDSVISTLDLDEFVPKIEYLDSINYDKIFHLYKEECSNAANYHANLFGNYNKDSVLPLIEKYIGGLPSSKKLQKRRKVNNKEYNFREGNVSKYFETEMEEPYARTNFIYHGKSISSKDLLALRVASIIIESKLFDDIREEESATYYISCTANNKSEKVKNLIIDYTTSIDNYKALNIRIRQLMKYYVDNGFIDTDITNSKDILKRTFLLYYDIHLTDKDRNKLIDKITEKDVNKVFRSLMNQGNCAEIIQVGVPKS